MEIIYPKIPHNGKGASRSHEHEERHVERDRLAPVSRKKHRRDRSRSKERDRSRSRERERGERRDKKEDKKEAVEEKERDGDQVFDSTLEKERLQNELEAEMQKRRERIEKWRAERREADLKKEVSAKREMLANLAARKQWTLDEEGDDDEEPMVEIKTENEVKEDGEPVPVEPEVEPMEVKQEEEEVDEEDPLDAFMKGVQDEVRKINPSSQGSSKQGSQKVVIMKSGIAKSTAEKKDKGELIEQNIDGLEYSSEEEKDDMDGIHSSINQNKNKKDLVKVDHTSVSYSPFRKSFYREVPELARYTAEEVETYRCEMEGIRVKGKGCPKPIRTWAQAGVSKKELETLKKLGFEKPTPIQSQAIPAIMSGRDLIGIAKTGSGKTLAFLLPMFRHILDQPQLEETDGPISILMAPTRELCMQIGKDAKKFCKSLNLRVVCVYGGTGISEQIAELKRGAEIIVCTPGRMIDMLAANSGRVTNLRRVTYIVLDEADRMFDMGFEPQVMRIIDNVRPDRQTVMFSATFPRQMEALARRVLNKPVEVIVGGRSIVCKDVEQNVIVLEDEQKFFKLLELLGNYQEKGSVIVFVDKQESADQLLKELMKNGYSCLSLHGGIDQYDRDSTITDFKSGRAKLLVATSVAARGLDVKQLILVVNYDCPNHYEDYVHRCGRTGRAGNKGFAYTFLTSDQERHAGDIIKAMEMSGTEVPVPLQELWDGYKAKQEGDGKKVKSGTGGFSGKGFKFDDTEAQMANEKKKFQKHALGLEDSDDEDIEGDVEQQIESLIKTKRIVKEVTPAVLAQQGTSNPTTVQSSTDKLELAKKLASRIQAEKNLGTDMKAQFTAERIMKGNIMAPQPKITAKNVAEQLAAKLNTRLNYQPPEELQSTSTSDSTPFTIESTNPPVQKKYEEELEINEFPQQARWRITSKETLAQIGDYSEAGITVRGTYVPTGKNPPEGERKLYLAIESMSDLAVSKAKSEICRILKEEMLRIQTSAHHFMGSKGRYKVV
ncbi:unnamed protein product [Allacma fusca]|uniref:Probable ATP-dependent RNA helicase DDX46 n=1 Tax=Allacma fusca TaxID=39272 RepID=A0A8J2PBP2_9HEXA|nr:unnamed protein product [Allacma fusca]